MRHMVLVTTGQLTPEKGLRVRVEGLVYLVERAEPPDKLDGLTTITECEVVPADGGRGSHIINCKLLEEWIT